MGRGIRTLLFGCVGLLVLACLCAGLVSLATGQLLGGVLGLVSEVIQPPYDVGTRPLPSGPLAETMLPPRVATFTRGTLARAAGGGSQTAYSGDGVQVEARAVYFNSATEAQVQVRRIYQSLTGTRTVSFLELGDPTTLRVVFQTGRARMVWSRGSYLFDVQAPSESGLDTFMTAFPY